MLNSRHLRLFGAVISGFLSVAGAMGYEPFPNCSEVAQIDSSRKLVYKDAIMDPDLAPYTGRDLYKYFPRSCYPLQAVQYPYYMPGQVNRVDYHQGSAPGVFDFVWTLIGEDSTFIYGTAYYSTTGELDSGSFWYTNELETGGLDSVFVLRKTIKLPQYQLIRNYERVGSGSLEFLWGDSIVTTATGKTIYSVDSEDSVVTRCAYVGLTYVCEESTSPIGFSPQKSIWFLTQGRKDSLQVWENGELLSTEKYFWSARTAGIRTPRVRTSVSAATSVWDEFDIMGRTRSDRTKSDRKVSGKTTSDRNKAWSRTQY